MQKPIHTNRMFTGLWTQRNPLRDAAVPYMYERSGSGARYDSLIDGLNLEMSARLTFKRRAGHSVYNSETFPEINRFHEFRTFNQSIENIRVMADCPDEVFDATGPNTKDLIFTKSAGAGSTYFQTVGNTLFMGNGVDQKKWVQSAKVWLAATTFASRDFLIDSNLNIQVATGARNVAISSVAITANVCTMTFAQRVALAFYAGMTVDLSELTTATFLNGESVLILSVNYNQITFAFVHADYAQADDTGTAATAGGPTGGAEPVWGANVNDVTVDGDEQWLCKGSSVQNWGLATPLLAPSVANAPRPSVYSRWEADTFYFSSLSIVDSNGNIQMLTTGGTTGAAEPVWNVALGGTTADGSAVWTNNGPAAWAGTTAFAVDDIIYVTWTYYVTVPGSPYNPCFSRNTKIRDGHGRSVRFDKLGHVAYVMTEFGPKWADVVAHDFTGEMIDMGDGELVTLCHRIKRPGHPQADAEGYVKAELLFQDKPRTHYAGKVYNLSVHTINPAHRHYILENGHVAHNLKWDDPYSPEGSSDYTYPVTASAFFQCTTDGITAAAEPAWAEGIGVTIVDGTVVWTNIGGGPTWADIGALKKVSLNTTVLDDVFNLQHIVTAGKSGATEPTWNAAEGATTLDNDASWVNGGPFSTAGSGAWVYSFAEKNSVTNTISTRSPLSASIIVAAGNLVTLQGVRGTDPQTDVIQIYRTAQGGSTQFLRDEIPAPGVGETFTYQDAGFDNALNILIQAETLNIVPPAGIINLAYHFGRVWGSLGNTVYYAAGPNVLNGAGNEAFRPLFSFIFPSRVVRLWPTSIGLIVFCASDTFIILGQGTDNSGFYPLTFLEGIGLLSYDAFTVNGSTAYLMTNATKQISLDPGAGVTEIGFPIGDQFATLFNPATTYCAWHEGGSGNTALFVADGVDSWFRMSPTSAPETGFMWSPKATIVAGCKAVQSVDGDLLIGPGAAGGQILKRNTAVNQDNGVPFAYYGTVGSIILAQPGQVAKIDFVTLDSVRVGTRPVVGLLLDEVSGTFSPLQRNIQDPPLLPPSSTLFNDRYYMGQLQQAAFCRHLQIKFSWAAEDAPNELLSYTLFGGVFQEA